VQITFLPLQQKNFCSLGLDETELRDILVKVLSLFSSGSLEIRDNKDNRDLPPGNFNEFLKSGIVTSSGKRRTADEESN